MRRVDIARNFAEQYPASKAFSDVALVREPSASSVAISSGGPV
jgi:hypothetical protein